MSAALLGNRSAPAFVDVPTTYQGLPGPGVPNLTPRVGPPLPPQPEELQGVGRAPGERWEHRSHVTTVNPYWYLDIPYLYDVPVGGGGLPVAVNDRAAWKDALRRVLTDEALAARLARESGARPLPTWAGAAQSLP